MIIENAIDFFDDGIIKVVYRNEQDRNRFDTYGYITKEKPILLKPIKATLHTVYINNRTYERMRALAYTGSDERLKRFFDNLNTPDDFYNFTYVLTYTDKDLLS